MLVLAVAAQIVGTIVTAPSLSWNVVLNYLFHQRILEGALRTLELTAGAMLMVMIYAGGHISGGHYNPAVTMAALVRRRIGIGDAVRP